MRFLSIPKCRGFLFVTFKIKIWITVASILLNIINYTIYNYIIQSYYQTRNPAVLELFNIMQDGVNFLSSITVLMHDEAKICLHPTMQHLIHMGNLL